MTRLLLALRRAYRARRVAKLLQNGNAYIALARDHLDEAKRLERELAAEELSRRGTILGRP